MELSSILDNTSLRLDYQNSQIPDESPGPKTYRPVTNIDLF